MRPIVLTTNGVARSSLARMDEWAPGPITIQCVITGAPTYSVQVSNDDPNSATNPVAVGSMTWSPSPDTLATGATTSIYTVLAQTPLFISINQTVGAAGNGVTATIVQSGVAPY
jgi:hypothetical protein